MPSRVSAGMARRNTVALWVRAPASISTQARGCIAQAYRAVRTVVTMRAAATRDNRPNTRRTMGALDDFRLDGLIAVIPGGAGGIGSALAVAFAEAGAKV